MIVLLSYVGFELVRYIVRPELRRPAEARLPKGAWPLALRVAFFVLFFALLLAPIVLLKDREWYVRELGTVPLVALIVVKTQVERLAMRQPAITEKTH